MPKTRLCGACEQQAEQTAPLMLISATLTIVWICLRCEDKWIEAGFLWPLPYRRQAANDIRRHYGI